MVKRYRSYLIRCWDLASGTQRFEVELIQTGERIVCATSTEAATWIDAHSAQTTRQVEAIPRSISTPNTDTS